MPNRFLPAISIALCLAASPVALADDARAKDPRGERLSSSIEKVRSKAAARDANKDGWLSSEETSSGHSKLGALYGPIERKIDANGDGRVSVKEYVDVQVKALEAADINKDGWLSQDEVKSQRRRLIMELLGG